MTTWDRERQIVVYNSCQVKRDLALGDHRDIEGRSARRRKWLRSCCWMLVALLMLLLLLFCIGVLVWFILSPKPPDLALESVIVHDVKVQDIAETNYAGPSTILNLNTTLLFSIANSNRVSVSYTIVLVNVSYSELILGRTAMPSFSQQAHSNTSMEASLIIDNLDITRVIGRNLLRDAKSNQVPLRITGQTNVDIHTLGFKSRVRLQITCEILIQNEDLKVKSNTCHTNTSKF